MIIKKKKTKKSGHRLRLSGIFNLTQQLHHGLQRKESTTGEFYTQTITLV